MTVVAVNDYPFGGLLSVVRLRSVPLFCRKAMLMLRKKKFQESLLEKTDKQLENIERMVNLCLSAVCCML